MKISKDMFLLYCKATFRKRKIKHNNNICNDFEFMRIFIQNSAFAAFNFMFFQFFLIFYVTEGNHIIAVFFLYNLQFWGLQHLNFFFNWKSFFLEGRGRSG